MSYTNPIIFGMNGFPIQTYGDRIAAEKKAAEEARLATEKKAAEEARLATEKKAAEEARLATEKQLKVNLITPIRSNTNTTRRSNNQNRLKNAIANVGPPPYIVKNTNSNRSAGAASRPNYNITRRARNKNRLEVPTVGPVTAEFSLPRPVPVLEFSLPRDASESITNTNKKLPIPIGTARTKFSPILNYGYGRIYLENVINYLVDRPKFKSNQFYNNVKHIVCTFYSSKSRKDITFDSFTKFNNYLELSKLYFVAFFLKSHTEYDLGSYGFGKSPKKEKRSLFLYDNYGEKHQIPFSSSIGDPTTGVLYLSFNIGRYHTPLPDILVDQITLVADSQNEVKIPQWNPGEHIRSIMHNTIQHSKNSKL